MRCHPILTVAVFVSLISVTAPLTAQAAGAKFVRADGFELTIRCRDWGCSVLGKPPGGPWGLVEKGPGGADGFEKLMAKYEGLGFVAK